MSENTLTYPSGRTTDGCTTLLLIDQAVRDAHIFVSSANATTYPIIYSYQSTKTELRTFLQNNFTTIVRIGLVFETSGSGGGSFRPYFLDEQPFFNQADITYLAQPSSSNETSSYSENVTFMVNLLKDFHVANIDYLACNTLNYPAWVDYYTILTQETNNGVVIGASNDATGNIQYGGDWVMENTSQDIEMIYFNESIDYYTYLLGLSQGHTIVIQQQKTSNNYGCEDKYVLYGCGNNGSGQLGQGAASLITSLTPITLEISGKTPAAVSCGSTHTIVLMSDGTLYGCGDNIEGQLGQDNQTIAEYTLIPITIGISGKRAVAVSCGSNHTIILMSDGTLYGCGRNDYGQLGLNNTTRQLILTLIPGISGKTPVDVSCGSNHTIVLMSDGTLYGCGSDYNGQLGINGDEIIYITLTLIPGISGKTPLAVSCGQLYTIVLMSNGELYGCGVNSSGQLGQNNTTQQLILTLIPGISGKRALAVSCGIRHTIILMSDGTLYGCGINSSGQLGQNNTTSPITTLIPITIGISGKRAVAVSCGSNHTIILMEDGTLYGCGINSSGQLGLSNTTSPINTLTQIPITNIIALMDMDPSSPPITNICFPAGTPVKTDQGMIEIQNIKPGHHTIDFKSIKAITQTLSEDPDLICFEKDALYPDVPSEKTVMSLNHGVFYKGKWYKAQDMIGVVREKCTSKKIYKIPYKKGTILYNVLLETHSHMLINNLIVETLNPTNELALIYNYFNTMKPSFFLKKTCIDAFNTTREDRRKALLAN